MTTVTTVPRWGDVPREFADAIRPYLHELAQEMIEEIQARVPEYSRPLDDTYVRVVRRSVEEAINNFVDRANDKGAAGAGSSSTCRPAPNDRFEVEIALRARALGLLGARQ